MKKSKKIRISIIIVYYSGYKSLIDLIASVKKNKLRSSYEIIVVNNNKDEDIKKSLLKKYKNVVYIDSGANLGYAKGNNLGAKTARGEYLLIANPDTKVFRGKVDDLASFLETHKDAGIIAPNLAHRDNTLFDRQGTRILTPLRAIFSLSLLAKILPNNPYIRDYYTYDLPKGSFRIVDIVPGSAFMVKSNVFKKLKGFDENFFLYFEEMDFCKRAVEKGFEVYMTPFVVFQHDWEPDEGGIETKRIFARSRFYYFKKHFGVVRALFVDFLLRISKKSLFWLFILIISLLAIKLI